MSNGAVAVLALSVVGLLAGCASSHDLRNGEGALDGGYQVTKVADGIFYVYARTNASVLARYQDIQKMWTQQASRSCKGRDFAVAKMSRRLDNSKFSGLMVAEMTGYAICAGSGLSEEQVRKAIENYERGPPQ